MRKFLAIAIGMTFLMSGGYAFADKCKNVTIKVQNNGDKKIKTQKMWYHFDVDNKERSESLPNKTVEKGKKVTIDTRNLEYVKGYNVKYFKLQYQVWCGGKWSKSKTQKDTKFDSKKCENGKTYRIDISNTGC